MAWTTPTNPVAGTVITVAYAVTNFVNNLLWLRGLTGSADPPGSNYTIRSTSTTATDWSKVTTDMIATDAVTNVKIPVNSIDLSTRAADGSLTGAKVSTNTINGDAALIDGSVTGNTGGSAIASDSIHANRLTASLSAAEFARWTGGAAVVVTTNITDLNVTTGKLAAGAVTYDKVTPLAALSNTQVGSLALTTSNQNLAQITAAVAGTYIVHASVLLFSTTTAGDTGQNLTAELAGPGGVFGTTFRWYTGATAVDQNTVQAQTQLIALTVGQTVTLRAKKSGGTGTSGATSGTLVAERIAA